MAKPDVAIKLVRYTVAVLATALLAVVLLAAWRLGVDQRQAATRDDQNDALIKAIKQHDREAAQDRATAASNQKALLDYTAALAARQDALLAYRRAHGIHLPQRLVTVVPPPRIVVRRPHASHHVKRHRPTAPNTSSAPAGPGKSGSAPGHHKHPRHGHRHR